MKILTTVEAAEEYGTSASSISRAARRARVGVRRSDGRLIGLTAADLKTLSKYLRYKAGNPTWVKKK